MSEELLQILRASFNVVAEALTEFLNFYFWLFFLPLKEKFAKYSRLIASLMFVMISVFRLLNLVDNVMWSSMLFPIPTLLYFATEILVISFCFKGKWWQKALIYAGVKVMEVVAMMFAGIIEEFIITSMPEFYYGPMTESFTLYTLLVSLPMLIFLAVLMLLACKLFKKLKNINAPKLFRGMEYLLVALSQFGVLFVCLNIVNPKSESRFFPIEVALPIGAVAILCIVADVMLFKNIHDQIESTKLKKRLDVFELQSQYYNVLEKQQNEIRELQHDIRNHMEVTKHLQGEEAQAYYKKLETKTERVKTDYCLNRVINALLVAESIKCKDNSIKTDFSLSPLEHIGVEDFDFISIASNILDNAIEGVLSLPIEQRQISFSIVQNKGVIIIACQNPYDDKNKTYLSSGKMTHGNGNNIVMKTVKKYGGKVDVKKDELYSISVMLFEKTLPKED